MLLGNILLHSHLYSIFLCPAPNAITLPKNTNTAKLMRCAKIVYKGKHSLSRLQTSKIMYPVNLQINESCLKNEFFVN